MKFFSRQTWRKKDKSTSATPSLVIQEREKQDLILTRAQSNHQPQTIALPPVPDVATKGQQDDEPLRRRTKSFGAVGKHGPPANVRHGPPMNLIHGPPKTSSAHEPPPLSRSPATLPRRPPRPPQPLYLSKTFEDKHSFLDLSHSSPSTRTRFDIPPLPSRATSTTGRSKTKKGAKRTLPELEGVWREFLTDVQEDIDSLDLHFDPSFDSISITEISEAKVPSLPPTAPLKTVKTAPPPAQNAAVRAVPMQASYSEPTGTTPIVPPVKDAEFSLSLFPAPPPLGSRKRPAPRPLDLSRSHTSPGTHSPLPAMSPAYSSSSPDLTPIATPTTPRFIQQQQQYMMRTPKAHLSPSLSVGSTPSSSPSYPSTPTASYEELPRKPIRNASSLSHLRNLVFSGDRKQPSLHRTSSSDSFSDRSISSMTDACRDIAPDGDMNYLKSCGRVYRKNSTSQGIHKTQPGIAL